MPPRSVKLTLASHDGPMFGDRVPSPPKDDMWIDSYQIHRSQPGHPQTSLNGRPDYIPANATRLIPEIQMYNDDGGDWQQQTAETLGGRPTRRGRRGRRISRRRNRYRYYPYDMYDDDDSPPTDMVHMIALILLINLVFLILLVLK